VNRSCIAPILLGLLGLLLLGCAESDYQQLARYKRELEPLEERMQELLDTYRGAALALGEGYGPRLPLDTARGRELLTEARGLRQRLTAVETPPAAAAVAEVKGAAAASLVAAWEDLDAFLHRWADRVPGPGADAAAVRLEADELSAFVAQREAVEAAFTMARRRLEEGALALARAILASRGEDS
jgi:hypothetical protein